MKIHFFGKRLAFLTQNAPIYLNHILDFFNLTEFISLCQRPSEFQFSLSKTSLSLEAQHTDRRKHGVYILAKEGRKERRGGTFSLPDVPRYVH